MSNSEMLRPSTVLSAMVAGLLNSKKDSRFVIEMSSFGHVKNEICYGCAASAALVEMFGGREVNFRDNVYPC
jgi:hypothetical protein